jgi:hypothetical protein
MCYVKRNSCACYLPFSDLFAVLRLLPTVGRSRLHREYGCAHGAGWGLQHRLHCSAADLGLLCAGRQILHAFQDGSCIAWNYTAMCNVSYEIVTTCAAGKTYASIDGVLQCADQ